MKQINKQNNLKALIATSVLKNYVETLNGGKIATLTYS